MTTLLALKNWETGQDTIAGSLQSPSEPAKLTLKGAEAKTEDRMQELGVCPLIM